MTTMIDWVQRSTIHGVNHFYSATTRIAKFIWMFLFIIGIVAISVNIVFVTIKYFSHPTMIMYTLDHETFIWPDLTFCNPTSPFHFKPNSKALKHWKQVIGETKDLINILNNETDVFEIVHYGNGTNVELEERTLAMSSSNPQILDSNWYGNEFLHVYYTQSHSGIFFTKEYKGSRPSDIKEDVKPMFSTQIVQIGNNIPCHTFRLDKSKLLDPTSIQSLIFTLKFDYDSYRIFNSSYVYRSIFLYITNRDELPQDNEIILTPGFSNTVKISQSRFHYNGVRRKCRPETFKIELYDALLQSTREFEGDEEDCKEIVSQSLFVDSCRCYSPFLPIYKNEEVEPRLCLNATYFNRSKIVENAKCMVQVYNKYKDQALFNKIFHKECDKYKPIKCDSLSYKIEERKEMFVEMWANSSNDRRYDFIKSFYQSFYGSKKVQHDFIHKIRDSYIRFAIERQSPFGDLYKEQRAYRFSELLSDIGGLMGLWLGMSVVGLFEIGEYLYLYISSLCQDKKKDLDEKDKNEDICLVENV